MGERNKDSNKAVRRRKKKLGNKMDEEMVGPRLFCEVCFKSKVLSPCYFCQSKGKKLNKRCCRGCGFIYYSHKPCKKEHKICRVLAKERLLLKINEISMKKVICWGLSECELSELPVEISQLPNLQYLDLSKNQLRELPAEIGLLTNLQYLDLDSNQLKELPTEIGQLTNLQTLILGNNNLSKRAIQELKKALPNCDITE